MSLLLGAFFSSLWQVELNGWDPADFFHFHNFAPAFVWGGRVYISAKLYSVLGEYFGLIVLDTLGSVVSVQHADFPQEDVRPLPRSISMTPFGTIYQLAHGTTQGADTHRYLILAEWDTSGRLLWARKALELEGVKFSVHTIFLTDFNSRVYAPIVAIRNTSDTANQFNIGAAAWDSSGNLLWEWDASLDPQEKMSIPLDVTWTPSGNLIVFGEHQRYVGSCVHSFPLILTLNPEGEVLNVVEFDNRTPFSTFRGRFLSLDTLLLLIDPHSCEDAPLILKTDTSLQPLDSLLLPVDFLGCVNDAVFDAEGNLYLSLTGSGSAVAKVGRDLSLKWLKRISVGPEFSGLKLALSDSFLFVLGFAKSSSPGELTAICLKAFSAEDGEFVGEKVWEFPRSEAPNPDEVLALGDSGAVVILSTGIPPARRIIVERLEIAPFESGEEEEVSAVKPLRIAPIPGGLRFDYTGRVRLFDPTGRLVRELDAVPGSAVYLKPGVYFAVGERGEVGKGVVR